MDHEENTESNSITSTIVWRSTAENKVSLSPKIQKRTQSVSTDLLFSIGQPEEKQTPVLGISPGGTIKTLWSMLPSFHTRSPSELDSPSPTKRKLSITARLNEEILILSEELKQNNEIIAYLTEQSAQSYDSLKRHQEYESELEKSNFDLQKQITDSVKLLQETKRTKELEIETIKQESAKALAELKEFYERTLEEISIERQKQQVLTENQFIEVIMNLNHKYIEEVEYINNKFRSCLKKNLNIEIVNCSDKDSEDGSTMYSPKIHSIKRENLTPSPVQFNKITLKRSEDFDCELDSSLRNIFNQISLSVDHERCKEPSMEQEKKVSFAVAAIFNSCHKIVKVQLKESFGMWASSSGQSVSDAFVRTMEGMLNDRIGSYYLLILSRQIHPVADIIYNRAKKRMFYVWKAKKDVIKLPKPIISSAHLSDFLKRKTFSLLWASWHCLQRVNNPNKIRNTKVLRKSIEQWERFMKHQDESLIEGFYTWRSKVSLLKFAKLKSFKSIFSTIN